MLYSRRVQVITKQPLFCKRLQLFSNTVSFLELIHTTAGIHKLLSARKERVAFAANIHFENFDVLRRARSKGCPARAYDLYVVVLRMNVLLHINHLSLDEIVFYIRLLYLFFTRSSTDFSRQTKKLPLLFPLYCKYNIKLQTRNANFAKFDETLAKNTLMRYNMKE